MLLCLCAAAFYGLVLMTSVLWSNTNCVIICVSNIFKHTICRFLCECVCHLCQRAVSYPQPKPLRKAVLSYFQKYENLTVEGCIFQFFTLVTRLLAFDVEIFQQCAIEVCDRL